MDRRVDKLIRRSEDTNKLRRFACKCASISLQECETPDQMALKAVEVAEQHAHQNVEFEELENARNAIEPVAALLRRRADVIGVSVDEGRGSRSEHNKAILLAFAASSALYCVHPDAKTAATMAAYEASFAHGGDSYARTQTAFERQRDILAKLAEEILGG